jgi:hypothetical protein
MASEEQKLKPKDESIKINDKNLDSKEYEIGNEMPLINYRKISNLSDSTINYFVISITLFINSATELDWFKLKEYANFSLSYFLFAGVCLYIVGILNWYEGKELLFLFDFIFAFYFLSSFFCNNLYFINIPEKSANDNDKLQGIFYILFFAFLLIIGLSAKTKGIIYVIDYAVLFLGFVFLFAYKYFGNKVIKYIYSYIFIVAAALLWVTGILKLINNGLSKSISFLDPTD